MREGNWFGKVTESEIKDPYNSFKITPVRNKIYDLEKESIHSQHSWFYENGKANANVFM